MQVNENFTLNKSHIILESINWKKEKEKRKKSLCTQERERAK